MPKKSMKSSNVDSRKKEKIFKVSSQIFFFFHLSIWDSGHSDHWVSNVFYKNSLHALFIPRKPSKNTVFNSDRFSFWFFHNLNAKYIYRHITVETQLNRFICISSSQLQLLYFKVTGSKLNSAFY